MLMVGFCPPAAVHAPTTQRLLCLIPGSVWAIASTCAVCLGVPAKRRSACSFTLVRLYSAALASLCLAPCTGIRRVAAAFVRRAKRVDAVVERQPLWVAGVYEAKGEAPAALGSAARCAAGAALCRTTRQTPGPPREPCAAAVPGGLLSACNLLFSHHLHLHRARCICLAEAHAAFAVLLSNMRQGELENRRVRAQAAAQAAARQADALADEGAKPVTFPDAAGAAQNVSGIREARPRAPPLRLRSRRCPAPGVRSHARQRGKAWYTRRALVSALCRVYPGCDACALSGLSQQPGWARTGGRRSGGADHNAGRRDAQGGGPPVPRLLARGDGLVARVQELPVLPGCARARGPLTQREGWGAALRGLLDTESCAVACVGRAWLMAACKPSARCPLRGAAQPALQAAAGCNSTPHRGPVPQAAAAPRISGLSPGQRLARRTACAWHAPRTATLAPRRGRARRRAALPRARAAHSSGAPRRYSDKVSAENHPKRRGARGP